MKSVQSYLDMQKISAEQKRQGKRVAFVPTMGFLHKGHLALVDRAKELAQAVVLSIYVNPTQFGPGEDFEHYPRDLARDQQLAEERGVDYLFLPTTQEVYPPGDQTTVVVTELTRGLCGPFRPGHFRGVATVVAKLFGMVQPDLALFGEKDYQQLQVIKRMAQDLRMPLQVVGLPTVREPDGLAMSSRNTYLSPAERQEALNIYKSIQELQARVKQGERDSRILLNSAKQILQGGPQTQIEYVEIVDPHTLEPLAKLEQPARLIMAVRVNGKRLIDNGPLEF